MDRKKVAPIFGNGIPALVMLAIAYSHLLHFLKAGGVLKMSHFFLILQMGIAAFFFIVRLPAQGVSWKPWDVLVSIMGTFFP